MIDQGEAVEVKSKDEVAYQELKQKAIELTKVQENLDAQIASLQKTRAENRKLLVSATNKLTTIEINKAIRSA